MFKVHPQFPTQTLFFCVKCKFGHLIILPMLDDFGQRVANPRNSYSNNSYFKHEEYAFACSLLSQEHTSLTPPVP